MITIELFLLFSIILSIFTVIFYILRKLRFKSRKLVYFLPFFYFYLFIHFLLNYDYYISSDLARNLHPSSIIFATISLLLLFVTPYLYFIGLSIKDEIIIELDHPSFIKSRKGTITLGKVMKKTRKLYSFYLPLHDLERHMFVCGLTGSGKSNFVQHFLMNLKEKYNFPLMLVEFKGEYHFLQDKIEDLLIIQPGENFSINIFNPEGSHPEVHAERIFEIMRLGILLEESAEYSPQMQKVLIDVLTEVCHNKEYQSWEGFYKRCENYLEQNKKKVPWIQQTLVSIQNRIRRYSLGPIKAIFDTKNRLNVKELFDRNILIDLSSIIRLGGEKEDALFFLNVLLKYLWDRNITHGAQNYEGIRHITIIEDAQYFAPKELSIQTKLTIYLEDIALLLRGTGECLISIATRPNISEEILANCGVLITFKNHLQKGLLSTLLNLKEEQEDYLAMLKEGYCIVRVNSIEKPFLLYIPYIPRHFLSPQEIKENNEKILNSTHNNKNEKPINENLALENKAYCQYCGEEIKNNKDSCSFCSTHLEEFKQLDNLIQNLQENQP